MLIQMLQFFIDIISFQFDGLVFQQAHAFPMRINCAPLLAELFLQADFLFGLQWNKDRKLTQTFNFSFRYIDDVLLLNNSRFCDYVLLVYQDGLERKDATEIQKSASYIDIHLVIADRGRLKNKTLRQTWWLPFSNGQLPSSNIPAAPAYGDYISQLIRYSRVSEQCWTKISCWRKSYSNKVRCSYAKGIATWMLLPSSRTGWSLRNILFSNNNGLFPFDVDCFLSFISDKTFIELDYK